jgi:hypothetical protein
MDAVERDTFIKAIGKMSVLMSFYSVTDAKVFYEFVA